MPNIADQAAADIKEIIEDAEEAGTPYILSDTEGEYPVVGTFGDIGSLFDPISGAPIQGRSIEATVIAQTIKDAAAGKIPARGWKARINKKTLYVQRNEYDRTIGLCRLTLGIQLEGDSNE